MIYWGISLKQAFFVYNISQIFKGLVLIEYKRKFL